MARPPKSRWSIKWSDTHIFKAEQEGDSISLNCVEDWCRTLDAQLEERFGPAVPAKLSAASLNFSRCSLDDTALTKLLTYLYSRDITVQILKLFRNNITDSGAWAVGQFMAHSSQAVHEVHLSHNSISEEGAAALLELIVWSRKYPYAAENTGRRDARGFSPIWLRLEHNCIDWRLVDHRLHRPDLTWTTAESRDNWPPMGDAAPTICLHASFRNQYDSHEHGWDEDGNWAPGYAAASAADDGGSVLLAALKGDAQEFDRRPGSGPGPAVPKSRPAPLGAAVTAPGPKQPVTSPVLSTSPVGADRGGGYPSPTAMRPPTKAPMQAGPVQQLTETQALQSFLDAGAARQMLTREDAWQIKLCVGQRKCIPEDESCQLPPWVSEVQEGEQTLTVLTRDVMQELDETHGSNPYVRQEIDRYNSKDPSSVIRQCKDWGLVEVIDSQMHASRMHIDKQMEVDSVGSAILHVQIYAAGRVILLTDDVALRSFSAELPPTKTWPGEGSIRSLEIMSVAHKHLKGRYLRGQDPLRDLHTATAKATDAVSWLQHQRRRTDSVCPTSTVSPLYVDIILARISGSNAAGCAGLQGTFVAIETGYTKT
ncbi:unnamed protein product, partial [Symbiodinium pilosum]